jgi:thiamine pyrophosphate-dependent acetolactate synthase large subunit-like protein
MGVAGINVSGRQDVDSAVEQMLKDNSPFLIELETTDPR